MHCPQAWLVTEQVLLRQRPSLSPTTGLGSPSNVFAWLMTLLLSAVGARKGIRVPGETEGSNNPLLRPNWQLPFFQKVNELIPEGEWDVSLTSHGHPFHHRYLC